MTHSVPASPLSAATISNRAAPPAHLILLAALTVVSSLWASWSRFPSIWTDDRNNGFVIAVMTMWVVWRDRGRFRAGVVPPVWSVILLLVLSLLWMLSVAVSAQAVHLTLVPAILLAWLFSVRGTRAARHGLQVAALFSLCLPLWGLLVPTLQALTVTVCRALLWVTDIPARVEGSLIHLRAGTLHVANSCAGFNFLMVGLTLGACYAFLFTTALRTRLKIVLAAGLVAIVSNWVRVFGLVVIGHMTDMRSSLMKDHVIYGWLIFAASMPLFFFIAARIERVDATDGAPTEEREDLASHAGAGEAPAARILSASAAAVSGPLVLFLLGAAQPSPSMPGTVPGIVLSAGFHEVSLASSGWSPTYKGAVKHLRAVDTMQIVPLQLDRYLYASGDEGAEMIGSENRLADEESVAIESVIGPLDETLRMAREALLRTPDGNGRLVWYWFSVNGAVTPSPARAKLLELWSFITRRSSSEITVLSAPCSTGDCRVARITLYRITSGKDAPATGQ